MTRGASVLFTVFPVSGSETRREFRAPNRLAESRDDYRYEWRAAM
ncbi:hypothetical protein RB5391 [Rhodopirellula baltica SH 1]|uniref:Uncharacterized protein n=1 Tax=Rhodopirellula baltica (strain DSM 10527 / NCIMB 13988 / SH1) TaxID=243090 RepID=Q7URY0_RHOBA|nr:hypothetical protein RB5391 [Rhodopirellula baltica SH 1]